MPLAHRDALILGVGHRRRRSAKLAENPTSPSDRHDPIGRAYFVEELPEREIEPVRALELFVRFDVTSLIKEKKLEDAASQRRQLRRDRGQTLAAITMTKSVNRQM